MHKKIMVNTTTVIGTKLQNPGKIIHSCDGKNCVGVTSESHVSNHAY